jgi:hypothetical protein
MRSCWVNEVLGENTPHIVSHGMTWDGTRASAVNTAVVVSPRNTYTRVLLTSVSQPSGRDPVPGPGNCWNRALVL